MKTYTKKPVTVEAITFDELVQYGRDNGENIVDGMPWSFKYKGWPISHERDDCYLIPTLEGTHNMTPADMLITGVKGEIYPCKLDIFELTYTHDSSSDKEIEKEIKAKGLTAPRVTPADIEATIASEHYFTAGEGVYGAGQMEEPPIYPPCPDALRFLTFCVLVLRNGFTVTGESACASPANFDPAIGRVIARANAVQKIWPLMGYLLKENLHQLAYHPV